MVAAGTGCGSGNVSSSTTCDDGGAHGGHAGADAGADASDGGGSSDAASGSDASGPAFPTVPPDFVWYVLDETQGTTATDSSPNHYDITNLAGVTWSEGANFDGMSGGGFTRVAPSVRVPPISMSAWLKPASRADSNADKGYSLVPYPANALSDDIPSVGGYALGLNVWTNGTPGSALAVEGVDSCKQAGLCAANSTQNAADSTGGPACVSASSCNQGFTAGVEYFVAVAVGPADAAGYAQAHVYVNGKLFDESTAYVPPASTQAPLYLGVCNLDTAYSTQRVYDGRIRDVRIYSRQLGGAEVAQMYVNGPTLHAPVSADAGATDASSE